ncbi:MAG: hypothetical protein IT373_12530 [Polyangiaceae bacterium]|nr:hypothetical protein [Polyangiaceae bacterium]
MHLRSRLISVACAGLIGSAAAIALAAPGDKAANAAFESAMYEDYLNTEFDGALAKLQEAIKGCGKDNCAKKVLSKLHLGAGVLYSMGKKQPDAAKDAFLKALKADPDAKPLEDFMSDTSEALKVFKEAQKEAKSGGPGPVPEPGPGPKPQPEPGPGPAAGGDLEYEAPPEGAINTPLPIFIKVPDDLGATKVSLSFKSYGGSQWTTVAMKPMSGGYGAMIPCSELSTTGKVRFYITAVDAENNVLGTAGTRKAPQETMIKNALDDDPPSLPGEDPPKKCTAATECPPDFPGCSKPKGDQRGDKGWGASCEATQECKEGFICKDGSCEQGEDDGSGGSDGGTDSDIKKNWISLGGQLDILLIDSAIGVCGASKAAASDGRPDNYFCFDADGNEFLGAALETPFNEIQGGGALAGGRLVVGYDRLLWHAPNPMYGGFVLGARVGVGLGGSPGVPVDQLPVGRQLEPVARDFFMFHGEVRTSWYFLLDKIASPFVSLNGGFAQVNAGVDVAACDVLNDSGQQVTVAEKRCDNQTAVKRDLTAYQITGLNFVGFSLGAMIHAHTYFAIQPELRFMFMVPTFGTVIAPMVSPVVTF